MNTIITKINNYLTKNCVLIFAIITLLMILNHTPFWDETHAFSIARLKLSEIFYITRIEGHTAFWYLILKPFSSLDLYPWSMFIINWTFCVGAIYVLWKYAPFNPITKTLITFSTPFIYYFGPIARCYSIGILFLFLICANYKKRFKKPFLFSWLIVLAANTSVMATIGVFYLGLIYLYDLFIKIKNKTFPIKKLYGILGIFLFCAIILVLQFYGIRETHVESKEDVWNVLSRFMIFPRAISIFPLILHLVCSVAFYYFSFITFKNTKRGFFFISMTYLTLSALFLLIYNGSHWNYYFYFIYFIMLLWLFNKKIINNKFSKILLLTILFLFLFPKAVCETGKMDLIYASRCGKITNTIANNPLLKNKKIYTLEWWSDLAPGSLMYLEKKGIYIYDLHNRKRTSFDSIKNIFYMEKELIDFDKFYINMDKDSYLISMGSLFKQKFVNMVVVTKENGDYIFKTENNNYYIKLILPPNELSMAVYKITKI